MLTSRDIISERLADYKERLAFIQGELESDRIQLQKAKADNAPQERIDKMNNEIHLLNLGIDQTQEHILKLKIALDES